MAADESIGCTNWTVSCHLTDCALDEVHPNPGSTDRLKCSNVTPGGFDNRLRVVPELPPIVIGHKESVSGKSPVHSDLSSSVDLCKTFK